MATTQSSMLCLATLAVPLSSQSRNRGSTRPQSLWTSRGIIAYHASIAEGLCVRIAGALPCMPVTVSS